MPFLLFLQIIVSVILVALVLIQPQDASLNNPYGATQIGYHTKTAPEKLIFILTIIFAVSFVILSLLNISAIS